MICKGISNISTNSICKQNRNAIDFHIMSTQCGDYRSGTGDMRLLKRRNKVIVI